MILPVFLFAVVFFGLLFALVFVIDQSIASRGYKGEKSDHFDGVEFFTPGKPVHNLLYEHGHGKLFWKWIFHKPKNHWKHIHNKFKTIPEKKVSGDKLVITFIGHSTVLIQTRDLNIITDPVFSKKIGPRIPFLKLRRYKEPGVKIKDLPKIDLVLLSHNHYDHLDTKSLRYIAKRDKPKILTPLGNSSYLKSRRIKGSVDMDWFQKEVISPFVSIVAVPAQHFSARAISDKNKTLWSGFVIETPRGPMYFAGDTGYGGFVNLIKEKYEKFFLALLPIGSYKPEWFMGPVHISPEEAVKIHKELNIETSVAIHFGTFKLADDSQDEAKNRIREIVSKSVTPKIDFRVLENGQSISL